MDLRIFSRVSTAVLLILLSIYFYQYPVFEGFDISEHEGETIPFYFTKIADITEDGYIVESGMDKERVKVISDAHFKIGEVVSFYGTVTNHRLIAQKHHSHKYPNMPYYLSTFGLVGFLWLMKREGN